MKDNRGKQVADNEPIVTEDEMMGENASTDNMSGAETDVPDREADVADGAAEWRDKYLRLSAEFDNYRKRTLKEKMELISAGGEEVIRALLPVMDDFGRALAAMETSTDVEQLKQGVALIAAKLNDVFRSRGVTEIEAVGKEFDTALHEAVARFAAGEEQRGQVIDVAQCGYKLGDKVIRYAKVVVGE